MVVAPRNENGPNGLLLSILAMIRYPESMGKKGQDDGAWSQPAVGGDRDAPVRPPGSRADHGKTSRVAEAFWRECDMVPLSVPRWSVKSKMNANIEWLLGQYPERVVTTSFNHFRAQVGSIAFGEGESCWDMYFRRRGAFLRAAMRAGEGQREGEAVHKAGDIHVDNERFHGRSPGDAVVHEEVDDDVT